MFFYDIWDFLGVDLNKVHSKQDLVYAVWAFQQAQSGMEGDYREEFADVVKKEDEEKVIVVYVDYDKYKTDVDYMTIEEYCKEWGYFESEEGAEIAEKLENLCDKILDSET